MNQNDLPVNLDEKNTAEYFTNMQRCTKCILPNTFPGIVFDEQGICNYCLQHLPVNVYGEEALKQVLAQYRGKGDKYDCILTLSGGRDSAFVMHQMVTKYKMRAIALTVDSGFITSEGIRNIKTTVDVLGIAHVWLKDEKQIATATKNTKIKFRGWLKNPSINTIVPVLNSGDKTMNLRIFRYAKENHIPLVLGGNIVGNSNFEEEHYKTGFMGVFPNDRGIYSTYDKIRLLFLFSYEFIKSPYNFHLPILQEYLQGLAVYFFDSLLRPKGIKSLGFFDYIYWREEEIVSTVMRELNWKSAEDATTTWRIGDSAYPLIDYLYYKLTGFTEHDEMYSKMIREGQIAREQALARCSQDHKSNWMHGERLLGILKELGVTKEQMDAALDKYRVKLFKQWKNKRPE
jgi:hypothetical protein